MQRRKSNSCAGVTWTPRQECAKCRIWTWHRSKHPSQSSRPFTSTTWIKCLVWLLPQQLYTPTCCVTTGHLNNKGGACKDGNISLFKKLSSDIVKISKSNISQHGLIIWKKRGRIHTHTSKLASYPSQSFRMTCSNPFLLSWIFKFVVPPELQDVSTLVPIIWG